MSTLQCKQVVNFSYHLDITFCMCYNLEKEMILWQYLKIM
nr:MAG TPA: hypothetical protein [Caudoviricetes sp.]DAL15224.1 MAG TPA_asm: hypothetical protein [Caudoviricetes sp.]DAL64160.1 MAG TPA_asm: hypothetical protein [Caudoviricetes sp.]DAN17700.1 MAG TPA: hypothetical protein [Caudoviricetes sp.]